jgi:hypothetical protein
MQKNLGTQIDTISFLADEAEINMTNEVQIQAALEDQ